MQGNNRTSNLISLIFGLAVLAVGIMNFVWIHPVPGVAYLLLTLVYLPQTNEFFKKKVGFSIHPLFKIALGICIFIFTLGVSDLGDMID